MARIAAHHRKANIHYLSTHMVHQATKPEYNCLKQGERATNVHLRLREITSENSTTRRRGNSTQILLLHTADAETGKKTPPLTALGKEAGFQFDWVICLRRPSSVFCVH